jgi:hypothetical protein
VLDVSATIKAEKRPVQKVQVNLNQGVPQISDRVQMLQQDAEDVSATSKVDTRLDQKVRINSNTASGGMSIADRMKKLAEVVDYRY